MTELFAKTHDYDIDKMLAMLGGAAHDVDNTAMIVIKAMSRGDAELYHPPMLYMNPKVFSVIRSIRPTLFDFNIDDMLKK